MNAIKKNIGIPAGLGVKIVKLKGEEKVSSLK